MPARCASCTGTPTPTSGNTIDLSQWIAGNPADVLATNFSQRPELFEKFPHGDVFVANNGGPDK